MENYSKLIIISILIVLTYILYKLNKLEKMHKVEHMTTTDLEAVQTVASMYNSGNKTLKLTNLDVTGNINATGKLDVTGKINTKSGLVVDRRGQKGGLCISMFPGTDAFAYVNFYAYDGTRKSYLKHDFISGSFESGGKLSGKTATIPGYEKTDSNIMRKDTELNMYVRTDWNNDHWEGPVGHSHHHVLSTQPAFGLKKIKFT